MIRKRHFLTYIFNIQLDILTLPWAQTTLKTRLSPDFFGSYAWRPVVLHITKTVSIWQTWTFIPVRHICHLSREISLSQIGIWSAHVQWKKLIDILRSDPFKEWCTCLIVYPPPILYFWNADFTYARDTPFQKVG